MDKQLKTELRKLLTGRTVRDEEGWLIAVPEGNYLIYHGITDRSGYGKIKCREKSKFLPPPARTTRNGGGNRLF